MDTACCGLCAARRIETSSDGELLRISHTCPDLPAQAARPELAAAR